MKNREKSIYFIIGPFTIIFILMFLGNLIGAICQKINIKDETLFAFGEIMELPIMLTALLTIPSIIVGIVFLFLKDKNNLQKDNKKIINPEMNTNL